MAANDASAQWTSFAAFKFRWLETVASDRGLPMSAGTVAIQISKTLDRRTCAMSRPMAALANDVRMTERGLRKVVAALAERGLLRVEIGKGRGAANVFRPAFPEGKREAESGTPVPAFDGEKPELQFRETGTGVPPIHYSPFSIPITPISPPRDAASSPLAFEGFVAVYPFSPTDSRVAAQRSWNWLSEEERRLAIEIAPVYLAQCRREERKHCGPTNYLRQKRWEGLAMLRKSNGGWAPERREWIEEGTPGYAEWRAWSAAKGRTIPEYERARRKKGFWRQTRFPPDAAPPPRSAEAAAAPATTPDG